MKKIAFMFALLLCCGSAFAFDPVVGDITTGFSRDDRLGVVKDDIYKLMWQDGDLSPHEMTHDEAVHYCENLNSAGFNDWRLPTIKELLSITDDTRFEPAINKAFKNVAYETTDHRGERWYWSQTKSAGASSSVWVVNSNDGFVGWRDVSSRRFVRCVRDY
ncbi:DUF1566 domain-containing protein [Campylobacter concisus]|jgi:hypothetical protein|uniref:DUF1566 domain-containing protein n=1 Tax=Campylobacter concisus TaxID=199 RepID=A0A7S9SC73_9BACT|nr:DUF1566 domain-containing protein [Campylobacter concisus]MBF0901914.1 DUF1566 domain-containing protein [Campylobacter concisus]MDU2009270.1 DUF1566 domain-containing protein [Campylobacter concisus]QPI07523.1 DUF1566 domain-containing protein [Campylobacter concisus]